MPKLLFVIQDFYYPDISGGSEQSVIYLFKRLIDIGWKVEVICTRDLPYAPKWKSSYFWHSFCYSLLYLRILFPLSRDEELGYPCWRVITPSRFINERSWLKFLDKRLREYRPDVVLGHSMLTCPLLNYAASQGYKTIYFVRHIYSFENSHTGVITNNIKLLANSPYAASIITKITNYVPEVILPFIQVEHYRVSNRQRKYITFINLIPVKGVEVAIEVALQLPEEKFLFVKGKWSNCREMQNAFVEEASKLPNVEIWEHQQDMRNVYAVTNILLVPSQFEETFGRVILEAQVNNIPVVAAKVAGIPYTLGNGGILVEPIDKAQAYVEALKLLRSDEELYTKLSELAFQNSQRQEFDAQYQVNKFVDFFKTWV